MNNIKHDVVALGELLIDFTMNGKSAQENALYEANPGGAPCNALAMLCKLGHKTAFIGKVGDDSFGRLLEGAIKEVGIDSSGLLFDKEVHTTLAFVHTHAGGEREFSFYRNPGADMMLTADEVDTSLIKGAKIFHFGTLSMTAPGVEAATKKAAAAAKEAGCIVSFDPNLREPLWADLALAKEKIEWGLSQCDVLKISDNEIEFVTGKKDIDEGVKDIAAKYPIKLLCATLGANGSKVLWRKNAADHGSALLTNQGIYARKDKLPKVDVIEKTGAGDTFCGTMLHFVLERGLDDWDEASLTSMLEYANAAASVITTRKGALRVMPTKAEIEKLLGA